MKSKLIILCLLSFFWVTAKSFALAPKSQAKDELHPFDLATWEVITPENHEAIRNGNKFLLSVDFSREESDQKKVEELLRYISVVSDHFDAMISNNLKNASIASYLSGDIFNNVNLYYVIKELIKNAFVHGNKMDLSLNVFIGWYIDEKGNFVIEIGDHGRSLDVDFEPGGELREYEKNVYNLAGGRFGLTAVSDLFSIENVFPVYNKDDIQIGKIIRFVYKRERINRTNLKEYRERFPKRWYFKTSRLENTSSIIRDAA